MKIFVSYSSRDAGDFAEQIRRHLASFEHYGVFTDVNGIKVRDMWSDSIETAIDACDDFVVIITYPALLNEHSKRNDFTITRGNEPCQLECRYTKYFFAA